jgi:hypothetical protein
MDIVNNSYCVACSYRPASREDKIEHYLTEHTTRDAGEMYRLAEEADGLLQTTEDGSEFECIFCWGVGTCADTMKKHIVKTHLRRFEWTTCQICYKDLVDPRTHFLIEHFPSFAGQSRDCTRSV